MLITQQCFRKRTSNYLFTDKAYNSVSERIHLNTCFTDRKYNSVSESMHLTTCFTDTDKKKYDSVLESIHLTTYLLIKHTTVFQKAYI